TIPLLLLFTFIYTKKKKNKARTNTKADIILRYEPNSSCRLSSFCLCGGGPTDGLGVEVSIGMCCPQTIRL
ncbi:LOW QUALITY PROTEIN: hypothetical protein PanWU01x14_110670, partial [Parasponia andersonii]